MKGINLSGRTDFQINAQNSVVYFLPLTSGSHTTSGVPGAMPASPRLGEKLLLGIDYWNPVFLADSLRWFVHSVPVVTLSGLPVCSPHLSPIYKSPYLTPIYESGF